MLSKYDKDGFFVSLDAIFSSTLMEQVLQGVDEVMSGRYDTDIAPVKSRWKPGDDQTVLRKINMPQLSNLAIRQLLKSDVLGDFVHEVTGAENVQLWWAQLIYKPPQQEEIAQLNEVTCHQDSTYEQDWSTEDSSRHQLFTVWIALSDVKILSGPLQFLKGSHRLGALNKDIPYYDRYKEGKNNYNPYFDHRFEEVTVLMNKGQISCHNRHIYHGSGANKSAFPRVSLALHLCADGATIINKSLYTKYLSDSEICPIIRGEKEKIIKFNA